MSRTFPKTFEELPAPPRRTLTEDQKYRRHRRFAVVLNGFVLAYNVLHKLALPLYVAFARSATFAAVDGWWLYHAGVAALLVRKDWDDGVLRAAAFFGAGGAACQIVASVFEMSGERNWHSVSLWVTSASTLWVAWVLVRRSRWRFPSPFRKAALAAAGLALGFFVQYAFFGFTLAVGTKARQAARPGAAVERLPALADPNACGVPGFSIPLEAGAAKLPSLETLSDIAVKDCGFPAAIARFDPARTLVVRNTTPGYLNVKVYIPWEGRWRPLHNMPLPPGLAHELPPEVLAGHPVLLMASDADPKKGLLLLVADPAALPRAAAASHGFLQVDRTRLSLY